MCSLKKMVEEGLIDFIALSEVSAATIRTAHAIYPGSCGPLYRLRVIEQSFSQCRRGRAFAMVPRYCTSVRLRSQHAADAAQQESNGVIDACTELGIAILACTSTGKIACTNSS